MLNAELRALLGEEGAASFVTTGPDGPHLVATWQSYIEVLDERTLAFPAGGYRRTEANLRTGSPVQMVISAKNPPGGGKSTGYRLTGTARLEADTPLHARLRERFPWCRAAVILSVDGVEKILG